MTRKRLLALIVLPLQVALSTHAQQPSPPPGITYSISGKVKRPGSYPLTKPTTVLEAINDAGGFSDSDPTDIQIARAHTARGNGKEAFLFRYSDGIKALRIELENGDVVTAKPARPRLDHIRLPPPP
jgi:protein involved in polysaccharide export with SLBB domain